MSKMQGTLERINQQKSKADIDNFISGSPGEDQKGQVKPEPSDISRTKNYKKRALPNKTEHTVTLPISYEELILLRTLSILEDRSQRKLGRKLLVDGLKKSLEQYPPQDVAGAKKEATESE